MNTSVSSPGPQGSSGGKPKRAQNVVPLLINDVLTAPEEGFSIEGIEVGLVNILGKITNIDKAATKTTYQVEDSTGQVDVVQWVEEGHTEEEFFEGSHVRAIGSVRTQGEKKHVMAFRILEAPTEEERDFHALQVAYSRLKMKELNGKMTGGGGGGGMMDHSGLSNSMMGGGLGGTNFGGSMSSSSASFGNKNYDTVYNLIRQSTDDQGINLGTILNEVRGKMSKQEMDGAIEFLSSEGHIYSTVDDEHFKTTDAD